ncbi:MAG: sigma-70 family RNA polymerase sigma factor [Elusimicrobia bacterium]|nr:sigma-70 family RNA polymerase sigma factor [Elusimicrobiota bacterium]
MEPEAELIARSKKGDGKAFSALVSRYEDRIFNLAHKVCAGMPAEAEDVYQETFLTAFKKLSLFREDSNLGTWLYRIASNLCWMRLRKKRAEPVVPILDHPHHHDDEPDPSSGDQFRDWSDGPEELSRKKALRQAVEAALADLPVDYRLVVVLRDIEGLSAEETAKVMKLSVAAVKSRLHRGRLFLRDRLDKAVAR